MTTPEHTAYKVMQSSLSALLGLLLMMAMSTTALAQESEEASEPEEATTTEGGSSDQDSSSLGSLRRSNRMEFDARLVRGETAGSGAVFLFQRAPRALPSMVPLRKSYLHRSVDQVLTPEWQKPKKKSVTSASSQDILTSDVVNATTGNQEGVVEGQGEPSASTSQSGSTGKGASKKSKKSRAKKNRKKK